VRIREFSAIVLLASTPLLSGCAAALIAPAVAGAAVIGNRDGSEPPPAGDPAPATPVLSPAPLAWDLPLSSTVAPQWQPLVDYTLQRAGQLGGADPVPSALLVPFRSPEWPARRHCQTDTPAVMIDLDDGTDPFPGAAATQPASGLTEALALLREAGVVVLWVSQASANRVIEIGDALRASGLDPTGRDPLLLVRHADERKQVVRADADQSVCVLAIAGDRRGDFDELFDFLRRPDAEVGLDHMFGNGWFLTPPPLRVPERD
jgi:hypothetical protein